jgi:tetratricopeptide (TPR) repeat protein
VRSPNDAAALLVLARSLVALGEAAGARARLDAIERIAPGSPAAAEAQVLRLGIDAPEAELEVQSVLRAASLALPGRLGDVAARARRLGAAHSSWLAYLAAAIAERRLSRWSSARRSLEAALEMAPGASRLHFELSEVFLELEETGGAVRCAQTGIRLEGPTPFGLRALGRALAEDRRVAEAVDAVRRALVLAPDDAESQALLRRLRSSGGEPGWGSALRRRFKHWLSR